MSGTSHPDRKMRDKPGAPADSDVFVGGQLRTAGDGVKVIGFRIQGTEDHEHWGGD